MLDRGSEAGVAHLRARSLLGRRVRRAFLCLSVALYSALPALASEAEPQGHASGGVSLGARIGNDTGEGFVDFILPFYAADDSIVFINPRASLKDEGETELNLGLVARKRIPDTNLIVGANAYLDRRESRHGNTFNQTGLGVEALTEWVDARLNYYHPNDDEVMIAEAQVTDVDVDVDVSRSVSRRSTTDTDTDLVGSSTSGGGGYAGNTIITGGGTTEQTFRTTATTTTRTTTTITRTTTTTTTDRFFEQFEQGREGWDGEVMVRLPFGESFPQTRLGAGYYDYSSGFNGGEGISGMKGRLEMRAGPFLTLDAEVFEDEQLNDTTYFLGARLHVPFDMGRLLDGRNPFKDISGQIRRYNQAPLNERLDEMVMRDVRIQMEESDLLENERRERQRVDVEVDKTSSTRTTTRTETARRTETETEPEEVVTQNGDPVTVVHVDDNNAGDPNNDPGASGGTYENPHATAAATNADTTNNTAPGTGIILVHGGSDVTDAPLQAESDERVLGEGDGVVHTVNADQGVIELPETAPGSQGQAQPNIAGVTISSENVEVDNFRVDSGSISTAGGSAHRDITIRRINSTGNTNGPVIDLGAAGGSLDGSIEVENVDIDNYQGQGPAIAIQNSLAGAQVSGSNIDINGAGGTGVFLSGSAAGAGHSFMGLGITGTGGHGIDIDTTAGTFTFSATDVNATGGRGINVNDAAGTYTFNDTDITNAGGAAFALTGGTVNITFDAASAITQSLNQSAFSVAGGHAAGTVNVNGAINASNGDGLQFNNADGTYNFAGTTTLNGGDAGIDIVGGSDGAFTFSGSTRITNAAGVAVNIDGGAGGQNASVTFDNGALDINQSVGAGVLVNNTGPVTITGGAIDNTSGDGVNVTNTVLSVQNLTIGGAAPPAGAGIRITNDDLMARLYTLNNNTITSSGVGIASTDGGEAGELNLIMNGNVIDTPGSMLAMNITGSAPGSTRVFGFNGVTANTDGTGGGILFDQVTFGDRLVGQLNGGVANIGDVTGPNRVSGGGLSFINPTGDLAFATLNIANDGGIGLEVDTKGLGTTFNLDVNGGTIDTTGGMAMFLDPLTGNINLDAVTSTGSLSHGIELEEFDGSLDIGTTTIVNPANNGIVVINDGAGAGLLDFGDTDISGLGAGTGVDLRQANGNITFNTLDITGTGQSGSTGIDLTGSTNAGTVMTNDTSNIQNVQFGVDLTNAAMSGMFQFGDGEAVLDTPSTIDTGGVAGNEAIVITSLGPTGTYNFRDVDFANPPSSSSDTSNLAGPDLYWVDMNGTGTGSRSDPGSITKANAATADAIVLVNSNGSTADLINANDSAQGVDDTLMLDANQVLVSFNTSDMVDLSGFGITGGTPANLLVTGITSAVVENPFAGLAPTLTTTGGNDTVTLADNADVVGVNLANGGTGHALSGSGLTGGITVESVNVSSGGSGEDGVNITGGDANYTFNNLAVSNTGGDGVELSGASGNVTFNDTTMVTGIGTGSAGINLDGTSGTTTFGGQVTADTGASTAVNLVNNTGATINFNGGLNIDTTTGTGFNATGGGTVNVAATGGDESLTSTNGQAVNLAGVTAGMSFDSITSAGAATGIGMDNVAGSFTVTGATQIDDATTAGISIANSSVNASFNGGTTILNDAGGANGHGVDLGTNTGTYNFAGLDITVNGAGAFGFRAQSSGTVNITGSSNQITSNNGTAILVNPTTVNATFARLTAGGGVNGISLTGMTGSLTVTGDVDIDNSSGDGIAITDSAATFGFQGTTFVDNTGGDGIDLSGANGAVTFNAVNIDGATGAGLAVTNNTNAVTVSGGSIGAADDPGGIGVDVNGGSGNVTVGAAITKTTAGDVVEVSGRSAGTVTLSGNLSATGGLANGIDVNNNTGGTTTFSAGTKTISTGTNTAVNLDTNGSHIINFTNGGLDIDTTSGTGFNATGGGIVNVTGSGNTVNTTTGIGVDIANTNIGVSGVTFESVSVDGAATGIILNNTGTSGGFSVTGDAGSTVNGSGGTLANITGNAIQLTDTMNVALDQLNMSNVADHGIAGVRVDSLSVRNATFTNMGDADGEDVFSFDRDTQGDNGLVGTAVFENLTVTNFAERAIDIVNEGSGTLDLDILDVSADNNHDTFGEDAIRVQTEGSVNADVLVSGGTYNNIEFDVLAYFAQGTGTNTVEVTGVTSTNGGGPDNNPNGGGVAIIGSAGSTTSFDINANSLTGVQGAVVQIIGLAGAGQTVTLNGTVGGPTLADGNTLSSDNADGIDLDFDGDPGGGSTISGTILVQNNTINFEDDGIGVDHRDAAGTMNITIRDNTLNGVAGDDGLTSDIDDGIFVFTDDDVGAAVNQLNVEAINNVINNVLALNNIIEIVDVQNGNKVCFAATDNAIGSGGGNIELDTSAMADLVVDATSAANLSTLNNGIAVVEAATPTYNSAVDCIP